MSTPFRRVIARLFHADQGTAQRSSTARPPAKATVKPVALGAAIILATGVSWLAPSVQAAEPVPPDDLPRLQMDLTWISPDSIGVVQADQSVPVVFQVTNLPDDKGNTGAIHALEMYYEWVGNVAGGLAPLTNISCEAFGGKNGDWVQGLPSGGATIECTATYTVSDTDIAKGSIELYVAGCQDQGQCHDSFRSRAVLIPILVPDVTLDKSAVILRDGQLVDQNAVPVLPGDVVEWHLMVTNSGDLPLSQFTWTESLAGLVVTCPFTVLAPDDTMDCTAQTPITQQMILDADNGVVSLHNKATVYAIATWGDQEGEVDDTSEADVAFPVVRSLALAKTAVAPSPLVVGGTITYTFTVTNTGNVPVDGVAIREQTFTGEGPLGDPVCPDQTLAPDDSLDCTLVYTITAADVAAGSVTNCAIAEGSAASGAAASPEDCVTAPLPFHPHLTLDKQVSLTATRTPVPDDATVGVGDTLYFTLVATNDGDVALHNVTINRDVLVVTIDPDQHVVGLPVVLRGVTWTGCFFDGLPDGSAKTGDLDDNLAGVELEPGESWVCTATYQVTQADLDAGVDTIANQAVASGDDPNDDPVEDPDDTDPVDVDDWQGELTVDKQADVAEAQVGDAITYTFTITNNWNVTVDNITVDDPLEGLSTPICDDPDRRLAPGESMTCTATYTVTEADLTAGQVHNVAVVAGQTPDDEPTGDDDDDTVPVAGLSLLKQADPTQITRVGQTVTYTFTVTNTGGVALSGVVVEETAFSGQGTVELAWCRIGGADVDVAGFALAVGATATCQSDPYVVTLADLQAGATLENHAVAHGTTPEGNPVEAPGEDVVDLDRDVTNQLRFTKDVNLTTDVAVKDRLVYTFKAWNIADVPMDNVVVSEVSFNAGNGDLPAIASCTLDGVAWANDGTGSLPANQTEGDALVCLSEEYVVSQLDIDQLDTIVNQAQVAGTPRDGSDPVTTSDDASSDLVEDNPAIEVLKWPDKTRVLVGQTITYSFSVENTGNVTVTFSAVDTFPGASGDWNAELDSCQLVTAAGLTLDNPALPVLAPGDKIVCVFKPYTTVAADVGELANTIVVTADEPGPGEDNPIVKEVTTTDTTVEPPPQDPIQIQSGGMVLGSTPNADAGLLLVLVAGGVLAAYALRRRARV